MDTNDVGSFFCEVCHKGEEIYSTDCCSGNTIEWHETLSIPVPSEEQKISGESSTLITIRIVREGSREVLGEAVIDGDILEHGCRTQDIVKLKLSNKVGSLTVAMNRGTKVPKLVAELEINAMPSKVTLKSHKISIGEDNMSICWDESIILKPVSTTSKIQCFIRMSDDDLCYMTLDGSHDVCKGPMMVELENQDKSNHGTGILQLNMDVGVEQDSARKTGTLGATLPPGRNGNTRGKHRRHITVHGIESFKNGERPGQSPDTNIQQFKLLEL